MDNYRVIKEAGKGTYGVVHMAEQKETGRIVAIKKISSNPIEGINFTAVREIKLLSESITIFLFLLFDSFNRQL